MSTSFESLADVCVPDSRDDMQPPRDPLVRRNRDIWPHQTRKTWPGAGNSGVRHTRLRHSGDTQNTQQPTGPCILLHGGSASPTPLHRLTQAWAPEPHGSSGTTPESVAQSTATSDRSRPPYFHSQKYIFYIHLGQILTANYGKG
ncbi:hypothetical protein CEXT_576881 [Caerostris extrusa]|uniref:Uncharacterized protein n=1 Tax=Caerostris extrusa TaxID=172846 RepID=A0AAV4XJQ9_CAEEX|nr:hypothetical protein CEXT_576881 [Caerostris extrusa]